MFMTSGQLASEPLRTEPFPELDTTPKSNLGLLALQPVTPSSRLAKKLSQPTRQADALSDLAPDFRSATCKRKRVVFVLTSTPANRFR